MAMAAGVSLRRRSTGGRSAVAVIAAVAAESSIERALIGSTGPRPFWSMHIGTCLPVRNSPHLRLTGQIGRNGYVGKERLTIGKRVAVAGKDTLDHRLLRKMLEDSFAQRFGPRLRRGRILQRGFDGIGHGGCVAGSKQGIAMWAENLGNAADIGGDHRNAGGRRLDHDI